MSSHQRKLGSAIRTVLAGAVANAVFVGVLVGVLIQVDVLGAQTRIGPGKFRVIKTWPRDLPTARRTDERVKSRLDKVSLRSIDESDVSLVTAKVSSSRWNEPTQNRVRLEVSQAAEGTAYTLVTTFANRWSDDISASDEPETWKFRKITYSTHERTIAVGLNDRAPIEIALHETATLSFPVTLAVNEADRREQATAQVIRPGVIRLTGAIPSKRVDGFVLDYKVAGYAFKNKLSVRVREAKQVVHVVMAPEETVTMTAEDMEKFLEVKKGKILALQDRVDIQKLAPSKVAAVEIKDGQLRVVGREAGEAEVKFWYIGRRHGKPVQISVTLEVTVAL